MVSTRWTLTAHTPPGERAPGARAAVAQTPLAYGSLRLSDRDPDINDIEHSPNVSGGSDVTTYGKTTSTTPFWRP